MSKDAIFIKRPLTDILEKVSWEISCLDAGFTTAYVLKYILDSTFLQITGALEQKVKCIYWELGNNNRELRYDILTNKKEVGECSRYEDKNKVFRMIGGEIIKSKGNVDIEQKQYWKSMENSMEQFYNSNKMLIECYQREFKEYKELKMGNLVKKTTITKENDIHLFNNKEDLRKIYDKAIDCRNRIAHNTKASINNLPDFGTLKDENYKYENLFARFAIVLLSDETFVRVFEQYERIKYD